MLGVVLIDYFLLDTMPNTRTALWTGVLVLVISLIYLFSLLKLLALIAAAETGPLNTIREEILRDELFADHLEDLVCCVCAWLAYTIVSNFIPGAASVALWALYNIYPLSLRLEMTFLTTYGDKLRKVT